MVSQTEKMEKLLVVKQLEGVEVQEEGRGEVAEAGDQQMTYEDLVKLDARSIQIDHVYRVYDWVGVVVSVGYAEAPVLDRVGVKERSLYTKLVLVRAWEAAV